MLAFHNDPKIKAKYLKRAKDHREADEIVQGYGYWKDGRGGAIGCLAHDNEKARETLERDTGYPLMVNRLGDTIFEGLPKARADYWPEQFIAASAVGADLSQVGDRFLHWLLSEELPVSLSNAREQVDAAKFAGVIKAINGVEACYVHCAGLFERRMDGDEPLGIEWDTAAMAAWAAAGAAYNRMAEKLLELLASAPVAGQSGTGERECDV